MVQSDIMMVFRIILMQNTHILSPEAGNTEWAGT
jgi:hypothetical protein